MPRGMYNGHEGENTMANNVTVQQLGAQPQVINDASSISELIEKLGLDSPSVKVNGETQDENYSLKDYDFVSFGSKVKGG